MFKVEIIGNLGADAVLQNVNGKEFITFRVAHTDKYTNQTTGEVTEQTIWASCLMNGRQEALSPYLKKGQKVFCRGNGSLRVFSSEKYKTMVAGLDLRVNEIELVGTTEADRQAIAAWNNCAYALQQKGYTDFNQIPNNPNPQTQPS